MWERVNKRACVSTGSSEKAGGNVQERTSKEVIKRSDGKEFLCPYYRKQELYRKTLGGGNRCFQHESFRTTKHCNCLRVIRFLK